MKASQLHGKPHTTEPPRTAGLEDWRARKSREANAAKGIETVTGNFPPVRLGQAFRFQGDWVINPKYGAQLTATSCEQLEITHTPDLMDYLCNGLPQLGAVQLCVPGAGVL